MFCSGCGVQVADRTPRCTECGMQLLDSGAAAVRAVVESSSVKGFFILVVSFFTMPIKTFRLTGQLLREVGITMVGIVVVSVFSSLPLNGELSYSPTAAIGNMIVRPIGGILVAIAVDWAIMILLELLTLQISVANDIKRLADGSH